MAEREKVIHLDDLLLRRTLPVLLGKVTLRQVESWAGDLASALGWDAPHTKNEMERCLKILADRHGVVLA
jgi:glycerol-3-phosphate dehydrogenase